MFIITNNQGTPKAKTGKAGAMIQYQATPDSTHSSGQKPAKRFLLPGLPHCQGGGHQQVLLDASPSALSKNT